jgi:hypothetical protein
MKTKFIFWIIGFVVAILFFTIWKVSVHSQASYICTFPSVEKTCTSEGNCIVEKSLGVCNFNTKKCDAPNTSFSGKSCSTNQECVGSYIHGVCNLAKLKCENIIGENMNKQDCIDRSGVWKRNK